MTPEHIALIGRIAGTPESIELAGTTKQGKPLVRLGDYLDLREAGTSAVDYYLSYVNAGTAPSVTPRIKISFVAFHGPLC